MFKKTALLLASIFCAFFFITACNENTNTKADEYRSAIKRVLNDDKNCSSSSYIQQYEKMRAISLEGCPPNFKTAYLKHLAAWRRGSLLEAEIKSFDNRWNSNEKMLECFLRGLVFDLGPIDEMNQEITQLRNEARVVSNEISATFTECLSIASEYGVDISMYK